MTLEEKIEWARQHRGREVRILRKCNSGEGDIGRIEGVHLDDGVICVSQPDFDTISSSLQNRDYYEWFFNPARDTYSHDIEELELLETYMPSSHGRVLSDKCPNCGAQMTMWPGASASLVCTKCDIYHMGGDDE